MTSPADSPQTIATAIKQQALAVGFDLVRMTSARRSPRADDLRDWLASGQAGEMHYLNSRIDERIDPTIYFPGAVSVICVAANYHVPLQKNESLLPVGRIARYALGEDYHTVLKDRLHQLADWIKARWPQTQTRGAVDTAPVMEKDLAHRAGIGWMGKNTCIIHPEIGSYLLLGELMTTLHLPTDDPAVDRCGSCTRCIDACPTQAITAPYHLDARKCISYQTIEQRTAPQNYADWNGWLFGCDICQDVCPFNRKAPVTHDPAFSPRFARGALPLDIVQQWTVDDYRQSLKNSAIKRVKLPVLQRNAAGLQQAVNPPARETADKAD